MANLPVVERMNDVKTTGLERSPPSQKLISFSTTEAMIVAPAIQYDMKSKRRRPKNFVSLVKSYKKHFSFQSGESNLNVLILFFILIRRA